MLTAGVAVAPIGPDKMAAMVAAMVVSIVVATRGPDKMAVGAVWTIECFVYQRVVYIV